MGTRNPNQIIAEILYHNNASTKATPHELKKAFQILLTDKNLIARDVQLGAFLTGVMLNNPTAEEIAALLKAAFSLDNFSESKKIQQVKSKRQIVVGVAGSGKKGLKTINVSTGASLLAAAIGSVVAKTVSCSTSSKTGSADFLTGVGVNIDMNPRKMSKVLQKTGFGAFKIENLIDKFDAVYGGKFFAPHALSLGLAALVTPIRCDALLYGLADPRIGISAQVMKKFYLKNGLIVTSSLGRHYIDEFSPLGENSYVEINHGKVLAEKRLRPPRGMHRSYAERQLAEGKTKEENIRKCINVLRGKGPTPLEDFVCLNAGAILYLSRLVENISEGYWLAKKKIGTGMAIEKLEEVIKVSGGDINKISVYLG